MRPLPPDGCLKAVLVRPQLHTSMQAAACCSRGIVSKHCSAVAAGHTSALSVVGSYGHSYLSGFKAGFIKPLLTSGQPLRHSEVLTDALNGISCQIPADLAVFPLVSATNL